MLHQRGQVDPIDIGHIDESQECTDCDGEPQEIVLIPQPGMGGGSAYGGGFDCSGIVQTGVTHFDELGATPLPPLSQATLAVDAAVSPDGRHLAIAIAGNPTDEFDLLFGPPVGTVVLPTTVTFAETECLQPNFGAGGMALNTGQTVAVAFDSDNRLIALERDPNRLRIYPTLPDVVGCGDCASSLDISLGGEPRRDTGHDLFHIAAGSGLACASCHPGGGDDGRTWDFLGLGPRRTQLLNMGIAGTEPLHWDGDLATFNDLVNEVFVRRMGGARQSDERIGAMANWLETLSPPPPPIAADDPRVARGQALFESEAVGCASCHAGEKLTNNTSYDVGTGGNFQVPSLIGVYYHQPYIHTGCAQTLADRFDPDCGGDAHGEVEQLSNDEIDDLVAYLQSL
jgi:mono/diheme cytochrome c family protein